MPSSFAFVIIWVCAYRFALLIIKAKYVPIHEESKRPNFGGFAVSYEKITVRKTLHVFCMMIFKKVVNTKVLIYKTYVSRNPYSVRKT